MSDLLPLLALFHLLLLLLSFNYLHKAKITHKNKIGDRVSLYSSLEVLGTREAKLECLNRVQTPGLGFLPKQGLLAESGN